MSLYTVVGRCYSKTGMHWGEFHIYYVYKYTLARRPYVQVGGVFAYAVAAYIILYIYFNLWTQLLVVFGFAKILMPDRTHVHTTPHKQCQPNARASAEWLSDWETAPSTIQHRTDMVIPSHRHRHRPTAGSKSVQTRIQMREPQRENAVLILADLCLPLLTMKPHSRNGNQVESLLWVAANPMVKLVEMPG